MRPFLLKLHYYVAFVFLLPLVLMSLSGSILVFDHALDEWRHPQLLLSDQPALANSYAIDFDRAIAAATDALHEGERLQRIFTPRHPRAAILAESRGSADGTREILVNPVTYQVQGTRLRDSHLLRWLYQFHAHWLVPVTGDYIAFFTGIALAILSIGGIINWWQHPSRRLQWRVKRKMFLRWWDIHRMVGVLFAALLLLAALSGGTMSFFLSFGRDIRVIPPIPSISHHATDPATSPPPLTVNQMITLAQPHFPEGVATTVFPPRSPDQPWQITWLQPGDPRTSKGMSQSWIDPYRGEVVLIRDALALSGWQKWLLWAFPLHNGEWAGLPARLLVFITGLTPLVLAYTGTRAFLARRKPRRPRQ